MTRHIQGLNQKARIKSVELEVGDKTITLTLEEAKQLRDILCEAFPVEAAPEEEKVIKKKEEQRAQRALEDLIKQAQDSIPQQVPLQPYAPFVPPQELPLQPWVQPYKKYMNEPMWAEVPQITSDVSTNTIGSPAWIAKVEELDKKLHVTCKTAK